MTTTTTRKPTKPRQSGTPQPSEGSSAKQAAVIVGALLVVAVIVALIVALASGDESGTEPVGAAEAARIPSGTVRQVSSTEAAGQALPRFDSLQLSDPAVGEKAPDITASYFDNAEITIETDDGTPRVILFLAHWCPHCQQEVRTLVPWFDTNGVPTDVEVVAVSTGVDEGAPNYPPSAWFLGEGWPVPVLRDSAQNDLASAYGLTSYPYIVAIDGDGKVVSRTGGGLNDASWQAILNSTLNSTTNS